MHPRPGAPFSCLVSPPFLPNTHSKESPRGCLPPLRRSSYSSFYNKLGHFWFSQSEGQMRRPLVAMRDIDKCRDYVESGFEFRSSRMCGRWKFVSVSLRVFQSFIPYYHPWVYGCHCDPPYLRRCCYRWRSSSSLSLPTADRMHCRVSWVHWGLFAIRGNRAYLFQHPCQQRKVMKKLFWVGGSREGIITAIGAHVFLCNLHLLLLLSRPGISV